MSRLFVLILIFVIGAVLGNANDSLKIVSLQKEVRNLKVSVSLLQQENRMIRGLYDDQKANVDSLHIRQKQHSENLNALSIKMGADLSETNKTIERSANSLSTSIKNRTWIAICGILVALILLCVVYCILRKKILNGSSSIEKIKAVQASMETAQKSILEESIKLDNKLVELLDKQVATQPQNSHDNQQDYSLALKVADEIVRIETNLSRMDESVKGYKQLKKAVDRIRTNFLANGYEIVEMLGKPYNEGMKVVANFVSDDTLAEGEQKITGIIKPQINYKGKMIQSAQITVSQNI